MTSTFRSAVLALAVLLAGGGLISPGLKAGAASPHPAAFPAAQAQGAQATPPQGQTPQQQAPPANQQAPQGQQQPTFRTGINFVRVDAIVSDKQGNPITDLKAADFDVTEDNKPQKIETFKLINLGTATTQQLNAAAEPPREIRSELDEELEAARDDVRVFAIFLDDYHVRLPNSFAVRNALAKFLQTQLGPNDLVEIMYPLTPLSALILSRDHDSIARAVQEFVGRKYDYRPKNELEEQYQDYPAAQVEQIRNQVSLSAIKGLVTHLGGLREGRKAVILVSEGYTGLLPPQLRDPMASMPGMFNPARDNPNAGNNNLNEDRANWAAKSDLMRDIRNVFDAANHNNTSIYSLDPRGLATSEFDMSQPTISTNTDREVLVSSQDTLRVLADNTDGRAIVDRNDLAGGLRQVVRDSSAYYLLGYSSTQPPADGRFHEIKVRVRRPGAQVRARKGYWAPTEEERAKALAPPKPGPPPAVTSALTSLTESSRGRVVRTWIGTTRGERGKTRVTFVWEPIPPPPGSASSDRPMRVAVVAASQSGEAYYRGRVPDMTSPAGTPAAAPAEAKPATSEAPGAAGARAVFDVPPGKLQLRLTVEGTRGQVLDTDVRDVEIPDLTAPQTTVTTPAVFVARTVRDFRAITADPAAVPTANRQFSRTERLLIRFDAYGPGYTVPDVTARLLSRGGQEMSALAVKPGGQYPEEHSIDLPLAGLAAGEYLIEIKAKGQAGQASQMIAIRVTS